MSNNTIVIFNLTSGVQKDPQVNLAHMAPLMVPNTPYNKPTVANEWDKLSSMMLLEFKTLTANIMETRKRRNIANHSETWKNKFLIVSSKIFQKEIQYLLF